MLCLKICTNANCLQTSQIQFAHGNGYASVTAKSAAPSRQDVQRTDSLPSLSLSPDVCVPFRASDQMWIDTPQSRSEALTLLARLCTQTYVEKPCDLLGHYFRSGCQAKSAAKLRKSYACLIAPQLLDMLTAAATPNPTGRETRSPTSLLDLPHLDTAGGPKVRRGDTQGPRRRRTENAPQPRGVLQPNAARAISFPHPEL